MQNLTKLQTISFATMIILVSSCTSYTELVGKYESTGQYGVRSLWNRYVKKQISSSGSSIDLNTDSTFKHTTCGNILTGKWCVKEDTLLLFCESNKYAIDSFNQYGFNGKFMECSEKPDRYLVNGSRLVSLGSFGIGNFTSVDELTKVE